MKKLSIIPLLLVFAVAAMGQYQDTADMRISYFGIPSQAPDPDFVKTQTANINSYLYWLTDKGYSPHAFLFFSDSAFSDSYSTSWATVTNAVDSLFIQDGLEGFTVFNDSLKPTYGGVYEFSANFTADGDSTELVSFRFYNTSETAAVPGVGTTYMMGADRFRNISVLGRDTVTAGDTIIFQVKGSASGTTVYKHGSLLIKRIIN